MTKFRTSLAAGVVVVAAVSGAQAQTVLVHQVVTTQAVYRGPMSPMNGWLIPPAVPTAAAAWRHGGLQVNPPILPGNIGPCRSGVMPTTVVIDERTVHTGSYQEIRIQGDVYTPSYLTAQAMYEAGNVNGQVR